MTLSQKNKYLIMGILNITPDSFFDGGKYSATDQALIRLQQMLEEGADIIDIGAESSRPGSRPLPFEEEKKRLLPLLRQINENFPKLTLSIDTYKPEIAQLCLENGASMINDIFGLTKKGMAETIAGFNASAVIMHMKGTPLDMQKSPVYSDLTAEIKDFFSKQIDHALKKGMKQDKIILDPGIGFGKTLEDNIQIINKIDEFKKLGFPVLIGASRKSMIGSLLNIPSPEDRKNGSIIIHTLALKNGADMIRVHDVKESKEISLILNAFNNL
ncbi:MAG TPA: dihydropteroate synthase [Spirochaetia bacterium]|nr:MAG: dihydropteroate synthase [Spirochaetes bacterium GWB1_36_13]HCL56425.1 dihydropteroate synthase [Spirochaetia bacterium]